MFASVDSWVRAMSIAASSVMNVVATKKLLLDFGVSDSDDQLLK